MATLAAPLRNLNTGSKLDILLVEDNEDHADIFMQSARSLSSARVLRAVSLTEALQVARAKRPGLIILDLGLPETVGLDTLSLFLESCPDIPVVVLTSIADLNLGEDALKLGAMDFLSKEEITGKLLVRSIRYALERWSQKRKLEDSLADLRYFGSMAAHDLVSPLNAIRGFAQLLELELSKGEVSKEAMECLELLQKSSLRSIGLVRDLHKLTSLGRQSIVREEIDLASMLSEVRTFLEEEFQKSGGTMREGSLQPLKGDAGLLSHVLQNLVGNALKYCKEDVPPVVSINCYTDDGLTIVCVEDNGLGIDENDSNRIFLPFERLANSTSHGSGLGLSICKKIVEAHGGEIWIESTQGVGTRFFFHLGS